MPLALHAVIDRQVQSGPGRGMVPQRPRCGKGGFRGSWARIRDFLAASLLLFKAGRATFVRPFQDGCDQGSSGRH